MHLDNEVSESPQTNKQAKDGWTEETQQAKENMGGSGDMAESFLEYS